MAVAVTLDDWGDFFVAQAGAAVALAGLVFVGVSINLDKIIAIPSLPGRALEAMVLLVAVLVESSVQSWASRRSRNRRSASEWTSSSARS
jgi:hypothetical protein